MGATYQVSFYIFIAILTTDIIFMTKELLLAFSNQVLMEDFFGSVSDDTSVELENSVH